MNHLFAFRIGQPDTDVDPLLGDDDAQELPRREGDRVAMELAAGERVPAGSERRKIAVRGLTAELEAHRGEEDEERAPAQERRRAAAGRLGMDRPHVGSHRLGPAHFGIRCGGYRIPGRCGIHKIVSFWQLPLPL
jgi:hypothetical protein